MTAMQFEFLNQKQMNRKAFIHTLVRGGILATMALLAGVLISRKQISLEKECGLNLQCRSCTRLKACELPEAKSERGDEKG
jgi:hypothetical protein